jgi:hypothetical protein
MMGSNDVSMILLGILGGAVALGVAIALIVVSVKVTGGLLAAIGWLIKHLFRFVFGLIKDAVSLVGSIIASIVAVPFATFNVVLARWEAAGRWGGALKRETLNVGYRCYSIVLRRPLQLLCLDGLLEGVEKRLPQEDEVNASAASPFVPDPTVRRGPSEFDGYTIEGTLRPGGSGAKLYIARPDDEIRRRLNIACDRVVIKSFALEEGSSLPQIVRESRALDSARALGLVFDHGLDGGRFWYAMPYHPGESLAETTRFLHARSGSEGLHGDELREAIGFASDLVATLARYHDGGLWHKDVKPDNIIVHDGRAHLVDLGPGDAAPLGDDADDPRHRVLPRSRDGPPGPPWRPRPSGRWRQVRRLRRRRGHLLHAREHLPRPRRLELLHEAKPRGASLDRAAIDGRVPPALSQREGDV